MHSRKINPKLPILDGIMDAVSNGLRTGLTPNYLFFYRHWYRGRVGLDVGRSQ